jgi:hypothetical protein
VPKCRDNRTARMKRDRRQLKRLAAKRLAPLVYRAASVSPEYYDAVIGRPKTKVRGGVRSFDLARMKYRVRANAKYHALMRQLLEMSRGLTADLSALGGD